MRSGRFLAAAMLLLSVSICAAAETAKKAPDRKTLEKEFSEKLSGSALVGAFTMDGQPGDKAPTTERYELESVTKADGDFWVFVARMNHGGKQVTIPLTLKVVWAGDTPMISLTDFEIPGMGTFTARVFFYGDRYAGTWQHGPAGGHLFGKIEKGKPATESKSGK